MTLKTQYYDVIQTYGGANSQMRYYQQLSQPIIERASDFYMAIDRFKIPMTNVPIFIFNPATDFYTFEIEYNGIKSGKTALVYKAPALLSTLSAYYYYVYSYDFMISMMNTALSTAFTTLSGLVTLPTGSIAPHFEIDSTTHIISLVAQVDFYDETLTTPIRIFCNTNMHKFVMGIPASYDPSDTNGRNVLFSIFDVKNNIIAGTPSDFYKMSTEFGSQTLINWNVAQGFVITSDTLPVNPEYLPIMGGQTILNTRPIVSNFDFIYTSDMTKGFTAQYILQSPYKTLDLVGTQPVTTIDLTVYWYDNLNNLYPVYLRLDEAMSIRLNFIPRNKN